MSDKTSDKTSDRMNDTLDDRHAFHNRHVDALYQGALVAVGIGWALFQLLLPRAVILDSVTVRLIHLAFAASMAVIISLPLTRAQAARKHRPEGASVSRILRAGVHLVALALCIGAILYLFIYRVDIAQRAGRPVPYDIIASIMLITSALIITRLTIGIWLPLIAIGFSFAVFFGEYLPRFLAFRGGSVATYTNQVALSTEGIFGIPLDVSANTVYLFVLLGALIAKTGAMAFFNDLSTSLFGRFRGGPAKTAVVASGLTGLVSGSSIANVVTTGTFTIPLMKKVGYPAQVAAATEVAASTNGQLMPPIMGAAAFIIAEYLGIGYIGVIRAAILPAAISYIALFYITHLEALRYNLRGLPRAQIPRFGNTLRAGIHHTIPLIVLIFDLLVVRRTPKFAAFDAIIVLVLIHLGRSVVFALRAADDTALPRRIGRALVAGLRTLGAGAVEGSKSMVAVALATATAGIVVGTVNMGIGSLIVQIVEVISLGNIFLLLLITAIASLVLGMGLPTTATYIVMASITVPIIIQIGGAIGLIIPAIAAHLFCFYFGILADDTPPVGLAAYAAAAIAKSSPIATGIKGFIYDLRTAIIPFMFILNSELLLIGVSSFPHAALIFIAATLGSCAFTSAVQGWALARNRWFEMPLFLIAALLLFLPARSLALISAISPLAIPHHARYLAYILGAALYALILLEQKIRIGARARQAR